MYSVNNSENLQLFKRNNSSKGKKKSTENNFLASYNDFLANCHDGSAKVLPLFSQ